MKLNTSTKDLWKTEHTGNIQKWKLLCFQNWKLSISREMVTQRYAVCSHNVTVLSKKKKQTRAIQNTWMTQKHQAEWKKSDQKEHVLLLCILNDPIYLKSQSRQKKLLNEKRRIHQKIKLYNIKKYQISVTSGGEQLGTMGKSMRGLCAVCECPDKMGVWVTFPS